MDDVVTRRWHIVDVYSRPDGSVRRVNGRRTPPAGTDAAAFIEQLRADGWEVAVREGDRCTLRRPMEPFEVRNRWVRADEYTERLATANRAAGMDERRAFREAVLEARAAARRSPTRRDADGRTLLHVPLNERPSRESRG